MFQCPGAQHSQESSFAPSVVISSTISALIAGCKLCHQSNSSQIWAVPAALAACHWVTLPTWTGDKDTGQKI